MDEKEARRKREMDAYMTSDEKKEADARTERECQRHFGKSFQEAWKDEIEKSMKSAHKYWDEVEARN